jgi:hypothetical protein
MKISIPVFTVALLAGCGSGTEQAEKGTPAADSSALTTIAPIDLAGHGLPLLLTPPDKQLTDGQEPTIVWKDETGTLEARAGDHFGLVITEEPGDIPRLKAALDRDLLRKNTLLRETPDLLTYRSEFPDDPSLVFMHFYQVVRAGDRTFVVQDVEGRPFNQQDLDRMMTAVSPKPPA